MDGNADRDSKRNAQEHQLARQASMTIPLEYWLGLSRLMLLTCHQVTVGKATQVLALA
jgi:hypothetical protein